MVAQFAIGQFRMIGWANASVGVVVLLLQLAIFHEKSRCEKVAQCIDTKKMYSVNRKTKMKIHWIGLSVSFFSTYLDSTFIFVSLFPCLLY